MAVTSHPITRCIIILYIYIKHYISKTTEDRACLISHEFSINVEECLISFFQSRRRSFFLKLWRNPFIRDFRRENYIPKIND